MLKRIVLNTAEKVFVIQICDIVYIKAKSSYSIFHLKNGATIISSQPLGIYEDMLEQSGFFRSHKSYLINVEHVIEIVKSGDVILKGTDSEVPVMKVNIKKLVQKITETINH